MVARNLPTRCPLHLSRRGFLRGLGASAAALQLGVFEMASSLLGEQPALKGPCRVMAAFVRPDVERYWMGWPGAAYDIAARQAQYAEVLRSEAERRGVALDLTTKPIANVAAMDAYLESVAQAKPDGVVLTVMSLHPDGWSPTNHFLENRGAVPTIVFSPMGTSFTGHLQPSRKAKNAFVGATQDVQWLQMAVRMLRTVWDMAHTRLCIVRGKEVVDTPQAVIGTTLHYVPHTVYLEALKEVQESDEVRQMADWYEKHARKIVEPTHKDILDAAMNYMACRKVMQKEQCHGFSMDCLGPVQQKKATPPCLAFSHLRDEGIVGSCEADWNAALSERLTHLLFNRPGFMQDPAPNTVRNTLMAAHCTCGIRLRGCDQNPEPFILRSHSESNLGVAMQVLWPVGERITLMKFQGPGKIILGTGKILANIDTPPSGGCRTSVECAVDGVADSRDTKGFHQLLVWGDLEDQYKAYCSLAGIEVEHI